MLDLVMAVRRPRDWSPADGTQFDIQFDKARSLRGSAIEPFRVRLEERPDGFSWSRGPIPDPLLDRAIPLLQENLSTAELGERLGISRAGAYRLRDRALRTGRLEAPMQKEPHERQRAP